MQTTGKLRLCSPVCPAATALHSRAGSVQQLGQPPAIWAGAGSCDRPWWVLDNNIASAALCVGVPPWLLCSAALAGMCTVSTHMPANVAGMNQEELNRNARITRSFIRVSWSGVQPHEYHAAQQLSSTVSTCRCCFYITRCWWQRYSS